MGIGNIVLLVFWQYSIPLLLSSGALVKSCQQQRYCDLKSKNWDCRLASKVDTATVLTH